jgi:hypothetical protein
MTVVTHDAGLTTGWELLDALGRHFLAESKEMESWAGGLDITQDRRAAPALLG